MSRKFKLKFFAFSFGVGFLIVAAIYTFLPSIGTIGFTLVFWLLLSPTFVPLFKLDMSNKARSSQEIEAVKDYLLGEEGFIVQRLEKRGIGLKSCEDGHYTFETYPSPIHKWFDRETVFESDIEQEERSLAFTISKNGKVIEQSQVELESSNGETIIREEVKATRRLSLVQLVVIYFKRSEDKRFLENRGYEVDRITLSPHF